MWTPEDAIKNLRTFHKLSQKELAEKIGVTSPYISQIESGKKILTEKISDKLCELFSISSDWLQKGEGSPFEEDKKNKEFSIHCKRPKTRNVLLATSLLLTPLSPLASLGIAAGVAADEIINRMKKAYKVETNKELAEEHLGVDRTTLTRWISNNHVPEEYVKKVENERKLIKNSLTINEGIIDELIQSLLDFTEKQCLLFKNKDFDQEIFKENFLKYFKLTSQDKAIYENWAIGENKEMAADKSWVIGVYERKTKIIVFCSPEKLIEKANSFYKLRANEIAESKKIQGMISRFNHQLFIDPPTLGFICEHEGIHWIDGLSRTYAARELGFKEIPVIISKNLLEVFKRVTS